MRAMAAVLSWLSTTSGRASTIWPATACGSPAARASAFSAKVYPMSLPHRPCTAGRRSSRLARRRTLAGSRHCRCRWPKLQQVVHVVQGQRPFVGQRLDVLRQRLDLVVGQRQAQLVGAGLDRVPAGQAVGDRDVARQAEVVRIERLVGLRRVEDRLGVDAGLVGEGAEAGDVVVERDVDADHLGDHQLERRAAAPAGICAASLSRS